MKKIISGVVCSFVFALSLMSISYAYDVIIFNNNAANYMATQMFLQKTGHMVLDVRPSVSSFAERLKFLTKIFLLFVLTRIPLVFLARFITTLLLKFM